MVGMFVVFAMFKVEWMKLRIDPGFAGFGGLTFADIYAANDATERQAA